MLCVFFSFLSRTLFGITLPIYCWNKSFTNSNTDDVKKKIDPFIKAQTNADKMLYAAGVNTAEFYSKESYGKADFVDLANLIAKKLGEGR